MTVCRDARLAMSEREGVETFRRLLGLRGVARVVVSTADLDARLAQWVRVGTGEGTPGDGDRAVTTYERPELDQAYVAPTTPTEQQLASMWSELLGVEQVGVHDDFLELGGHSLLATQLNARIRKELGISIALNELFESPTIAELATRIDNLRWAGGLSSDALEGAGSEREIDEI